MRIQKRGNVDRSIVAEFHEGVEFLVRLIRKFVEISPECQGLQVIRVVQTETDFEYLHGFEGVADRVFSLSLLDQTFDQMKQLISYVSVCLRQASKITPLLLFRCVDISQRKEDCVTLRKSGVHTDREDNRP